MKFTKAYFLAIASIILTLGCSKDDSPEENIEEREQIEIPKFDVILVDDIDINSAVIEVSFLNDGGSAISERGVCWSTASNPTISDNSKKSGNGSDNFNINLEGLESNTDYYVRAFAKNEAGNNYSEEIKFTTLEDSTPEFSGIILRTNDGGANWESIQVGNIKNLHAVTFLDDQIGYAAGDLGKIVKTIDGGENWELLNSGEYILNDIFFIDKNIGYAVGNYSTILKTEDGGENWSHQESGSDKELMSVYFTDENTGYIVGADGLILKTENEGLDWASVDENPYRKSLTSVMFSDTNTGLATAYQKIYKTTDGGLNWDAEFNVGATMNDVFIVPNGPTYAVEQYGYIYKQDTNESDWVQIAEVSNYNLKTVFFINSDLGFVAGFDGDIFKTTDGGITWTKQDSGTIYMIESVYFIDENTGIAVGFMK